MKKFKGYLFDIDNTLYDYQPTHELALATVVEFLAKQCHKEIDLLKRTYDIARKQIHLELSETAASHNRLLYFQRMLEILKINSTMYALKAYNMYWDSFIDNIVPYDKVYHLFELIKNEKLCLVTDLTADIQFRKIEKLGLNKYFDFVVTSEEAGREKPHPYIFLLALKKLELPPEDVCMIGDSYSKDIVGAVNLGIKSFWFDSSDKSILSEDRLVRKYKNYNELMEIISYE